MSRYLPSASASADTAHEEVRRHGRQRLRCSICDRRLNKTLTYMEETGDVPAPRQSWLLCQDCNDAVKAQMARAEVRTPLRLRVAVGVVSTERSREARRMRRGQLSDSGWIKLLFWAFIGGLMVHLIIIVIIAGLSR
jgi:hypothetical protein